MLGIKADVELLSVIVTFESLSPELDITCSEVVKYFAIFERCGEYDVFPVEMLEFVFDTFPNEMSTFKS